ncbi:baculoviral IAP repeat-containing protein 7-like [Clavelina lepadiformis]|uniref:baculoviral IAP repeat-containing protein 7-like n=1 Tax=Clavelina lepadiformis TaxID=159417 RepID=UPI004041D8A0
MCCGGNKMSRPRHQTRGQPEWEVQYRLDTFTNALEGINGEELARNGYFYNSCSRQLQCISCQTEHIYLGGENDCRNYPHNPSCPFSGDFQTQSTINPITNKRQEATNPRSPASHSTPATRGRPKIRTLRGNSQVSLNEVPFPCDSPAYPDKRTITSRLLTFVTWKQGTTRCNPREIVDAGFFCKGIRDVTTCWNCGINLENWSYDDDPYYEHAKWQPNCEYILQQKGVEFVQQVLQENPNLPQPMFIREVETLNFTSVYDNTPSVSLSTSASERENEDFVPCNPPSGVCIIPEPNWERRDINIPRVGIKTIYRAPGIKIVNGPTKQRPIQRTVHRRDSRSSLFLNNRVRQAMQSSVTSQAQEMGFSRETIESVLLRRSRNAGEAYSSSQALIEDLLLELEPSRNERRETSIPRQPAPLPRQVESGPDNLLSGLNGPVENTTSMCRVCGDAPCEIIFIPCRHLNVCASCATLVNRCPSCNQSVERSIRIRTD